jgi:tripartite ATP-independent transporter DctM subunit
MSAATSTLLLFGGLLISLILGLPLVFAMGGIAVVATYLFWNPNAIYMFPVATYGSGTNFVLLAIPMFIFMGAMLLKSGITDDLYNTMYYWMGRIPGGLAMGTVLISTLFAAVTGVTGAATVSMGVIALPSMLKRGYDKKLALGSIAAGGALGVLIPPSVLMVALGAFTGISVGMLLLGGILPGLLLSTLYIIYIFIRSKINPEMGPPVSAKESIPFKKKLLMLKSVILPAILIVGVLGSILTGAATPTEASAVGALGSILCAALYRCLTLKNFWDSCEETLRLSCMVMWIIFAANAFSSVYGALGAKNFIQGIIMGIPGGRWGILIGIQVIYFIMGMFLDPLGIILITGPIFFPLAIQLGFNPVWLGVLYVINMQMGFLTPPFGYNLFYLKAIVPKDVTMEDIYRSVIPFIILQAVGLVICMIWPELILWLPNMMIR